MSQKNINPWQYFLEDTSLDNEIAYRSLITFGEANRLSAALYRSQKRNMKPEDFEVRDILLLGMPKKGNHK